MNVMRGIDLTTDRRGVNESRNTRHQHNCANL